jgi:hypothetical protein
MIYKENYGAIPQYNNYVFPVWNYKFVSGAIVDPPVEFTPFILGRGLPSVRVPSIINFDFPLKKLHIVEMNQWSTASMNIKINDEAITEVTTLTGVIYLASPPNSGSDNWVASGSDLYTSDRLYLSSRRLSSGKIQVISRFDPSSINGIDDGQYYGIIIYLNSGSSADVAQAGIELIIKINNIIEVPV